MAVVVLDPATTAGRDRLGGKAWSLTEMLRRGIPVPPAFCLTTEECARFHELGGRTPRDVLDALPAAMVSLERTTGRTFGRGSRPLLVAVRSGAPTSMPGMMDTVLNLGFTEEVEAALSEAAGPRYAADTRRRFDEQFESVVGATPPADPWEQLHLAIAAVFGSWRSARAVRYRAERGIDEQGGTAVTVQAMVYGNLDERSGTGVIFSRDPVTGERTPYGEWLPLGQGEDVVSGRHDPLPLTELGQVMPEVHDRLLELTGHLDASAGEAQDIEFTVEGGRLWLLQCRRAKVAERAAEAAPLLEGRLLAEGRPAWPGRAEGTAVGDPHEAEQRALDGQDVILVRETTSPEDVHAMAVVRGIVTGIGGATSHAAVVSRELDVPCVVGCGADLVASLEGRRLIVDATSGKVYAAP